MAEFPAMPLWTDAYLSDTRHLSTEEHGAYLLLMMEAWRRPGCNLPDDDSVLARLAGLSFERWAEVKPVIMSFWTRDGRRKTWAQKRLSSERLYVAQKSKSQREKAAKRWDGEKKDDAAALPKPCQSDAPTPTPTPTLLDSLPSEERGAAPMALALSPDLPVEKVDKAKRGSRLAADMALPEEWSLWAKGQGHPDPQAEWESFRDYWSGVAGKDGVKLDWQGTWRNRVRKVLADGRPAKAPPKAPSSDDTFRRHLRGWFAAGADPRVLKHPPGHPNCSIPKHIQQEFKAEFESHGYKVPA